MLSIYDTLSRQVSPVGPGPAGSVKMFTCGSSLKGQAHIGDLRAILMGDLVRRALESRGVPVEQARGIQDLESGEPGDVLALPEGKDTEEAEVQDLSPRSFADRLGEDERKLNIAPAKHTPKASESIDDMTEMVQRLVP